MKWTNAQRAAHSKKMKAAWSRRKSKKASINTTGTVWLPTTTSTSTAIPSITLPATTNLSLRSQLEELKVAVERMLEII